MSIGSCPSAAVFAGVAACAAFVTAVRGECSTWETSQQDLGAAVPEKLSAGAGE